MTTELNAYYRALERKLECPREKRREFIQETKRHVADFIGKNPNAEFSDVVQFVGEPEELARTFNELLGPEVTEKFRKSKRRKWICLGMAVALVITGVITYNVYLQNRQHDVDITAEKTVTVYDNERGED